MLLMMRMLNLPRVLRVRRPRMLLTTRVINQPRVLRVPRARRPRMHLTVMITNQLNQSPIEMIQKMIRKSQRKTNLNLNPKANNFFIKKIN